MIERPRRQFRQLGCKFRSRRVAHVHEGVGIGQLQRLLRHGFGHFLAAIAHIHAPHAAKPVEVALAVHIGDVRAFALHNEERAFLLETVKMRPGMEEVIVILLPQVFRVEAIAGRFQNGSLPLLNVRSIHISPGFRPKPPANGDNA